MAGPSAPIPSATVLVVEDELLIGVDLALMLEDWGYVAFGPADSAAAALAEIDRRVPDVAILDVNLGAGDTSLSVARRLLAEGVPFLFLTGYDRARFGDDPALSGVPHLRKPVSEADLRRTLSALLTEASAPQPMIRA